MSRPRNFDEDRALDAAMRVFWTQGYEGTSLSDLTDAMGINRPSLYATFGNKESLFRKSVERYLTGPGAAIGAALDLPTAREAVVELLRIYAEAPMEPGRPLGCLLVNGALRCGGESASVRDDLAQDRRAAVVALRKRLDRAQREGDLAEDDRPADLAFFVWTILQGMAVQAASGATVAQLRSSAELAMRAWPVEKAPPKKSPRHRIVSGS